VVRIIAPEWQAWLQLGDGERRSLVDTWLTATFGFKERYSDQEIEAVCNAAGPEPYPSPGLASHETNHARPHRQVTAGTSTAPDQASGMMMRRIVTPAQSTPVNIPRQSRGL
jgi:hypothetical protein